MTEKLFTGTLNHNQNKTNKLINTMYPEKVYMSADLTKGSFGHFSSFYVIKISSKKTSKIPIFRMFLKKSQIASDM